MKTRFLLALPILFSTSHMALAAATPEEAARLATIFQTYLTAEKGVVTVAPNGDGYAVTLDVAPLAAKAAASGSSFSMSPIKLNLIDNGGGKWAVSEKQALEVSATSKDALSITLKAEDYTLNGIFDEKLVSFESATSEMKNMVVDETIKDPTQGEAKVNATIASMKSEQTATANANGGVDSNIKYTVNNIAETISSPGNPAVGVPPMNFAVTIEGGTQDVTGKGIKPKSVLDLVSFFVAHQNKDLIMKDGATLKTILTAAMPIFENVQGSGTFNNVNVVTPMGPVTFATMTVGADINGVVKEGKFRESISVTGLSLPAVMVPPWAATLVPKNVTFDFGATGFDLATPAQLMLTAIDFTKDPPLPPGFENTLIPAFLPTGAATITLNPTSISNDIYNITAEGSMAAGPAAMPSGKATVTAKGLDEIMKVIQAAPPEAGMQSGVSVIVAAKGMAKTASDGSLTWNIESTPEGKVLVNGIDTSAMK